MNGVSRGDRRSTEQMMDQAVHDAGLLGKEEHAKTGAFRADPVKVHAERNGEDPLHELGHLALHGGKEICDHVMEHAIEKAPEYGTRALGAAGFIVGTVKLQYDLSKHVAEAWHHGDLAKNAAVNNAVNRAVVSQLDYSQAFAKADHAARPANDQAVMRLTQKMNETAGLRAELQSRADQGFLAAKNAWAVTAGGDPNTRADRMMKALEQAGHKDKLANDVAFGKGVQYFAWLQGQRPEIRGAEESRIQGRNVERPILTGRPA